MTKLEELEEQLQEIMGEIKRIKEAEKSANWEPKRGEMYYYIDSDGYGVENAPYNPDSTMKNDYEMGNCFASERKAEAVLEKIKIYVQLKRLAEEINISKVDWNNPSQKKYLILYDTQNQILKTRS